MIKTERLILVKPQDGDLVRYFEIHGDPQTNLFNPYGALPDIESAREELAYLLGHWEAYDFGPWRIAERDNPEYMIGLGGLDCRKYGHALRLNLGYRFDQAFWGKGYATELAVQAIRYGFDDLGMEEIYGLVRPRHFASIRILEKSGFQQFGSVHDVPDQEDSLVYRLLSSPE